jgi:hypothetical protein
MRGRMEILRKQKAGRGLRARLHFCLLFTH